MIKQYLSNINKNTTIPILKKKLELNRAIQSSLTATVSACCCSGVESIGLLLGSVRRDAQKCSRYVPLRNSKLIGFRIASDGVVLVVI
jgi:hypothetical protein